MLLAFADGEPFATGAAGYDYDSLSDSGTSGRLILSIEVGGFLTSAIVDTGAPYLICSPQLARQLNLNVSDSLLSEQILIRGQKVRGSLHRINLQLIATEGNSLLLETTAFVPDPETEELGMIFPSFLGLVGCLERVRFAVDPSSETFYFGPSLD
ncbi:MAG: retroviral-like aspartic protease family protein [Blastocatellia bacterium]|nr:retroviral-like aspartic protease family protein [Blastocatellia bacterium]